MSSTNNNNDDNKDARFAQALTSGVNRVRAWDADPRNRKCLARIRESLPWDDLREGNSKYSESDRWLLDANLRFVQRLARYFSRDVMTWVNAPSCHACGNDDQNNMSQLETRGPLTDDEVEGQATRVEVYKCGACHATSTFPRYNLAAKLFDTKRGRCGEYANLFGLYCRAVGLEVRYVSDWTDHVWVEVVDGSGNWIMVDACEGVVGEPSMYEAGWGKALTQMVSYGNYSVVDVTPRYTRQFSSKEFQERRRQITTSEVAAEQMIYQLNQSLWNTTTATTPPWPELPPKAQLSDKALLLLQQRVQRETHALHQLKQATSWDTVEYQYGRLSGSTEWKRARRELGKTDNGNDTAKEKAATTTKSSAISTAKASSTQLSSSWIVPESFSVQRQTDSSSITVHPLAATADCAIQMNETIPVAMSVRDKHAHYVSVAVFGILKEDDNNKSLALWHSRVFTTETDLAAYVATLPSHVVVALTGQLELSKNDDDEQANDSKQQSSSSLSVLKRLGGLEDVSMLYPSSSDDIDEKDRIQDHVLFLGQVDAHPSWAICGRARDYPQGYQVEWNTNDSNNNSNNNSDNKQHLILAEYPHTVPKSIVGRLPDDTWSLKAQQTASLREKQAAFWKYYQTVDNNVTGFVTQSGAPVYLLGETAYPMRSHRTGSDKDDNDNSNDAASVWTTSLVLPCTLVPPEFRVDRAALEAMASENDNDNDNDPNRGPSYQVPVDLDFFHNHIGTQLVQASVGGSGTVVPTSAALENCRLVGLYFSAHWCGPCRSFTPLLIEAYETWKESFGKQHGLEVVFVSSDRDPPSFASYHASMPWPAIGFDALRQYKPLLSTMYGVRGIPSLIVLDAVSGQVVVPASVSRNELMTASRRGGDVGLERLLQRWLDRVPASTIELLQMLEASCQDHTIVAEEETGSKEHDENEEASPYLVEAPPAASPPTQPLPLGPHDKLFSPVASPRDAASVKEAWEEACLQRLDVADRKTLLETCLKYANNCQAKPWVTKFRNFRVSNKVVDRSITQIPHGLAFLQAAFGLQVSFVDEDYTISIPVGLDLQELVEDLTAYLEDEG